MLIVFPSESTYDITLNLDYVVAFAVHEKEADHVIVKVSMANNEIYESRPLPRREAFELLIYWVDSVNGSDNNATSKWLGGKKCQRNRR